MYTLYLLTDIVYHSSHVNKYEANKKFKHLLRQNKLCFNCAQTRTKMLTVLWV